MTKHGRVALGAAVIATSLVSAAAPAASPGCWTQADVSAAKIRELQTRLMVSALRCRANGTNILASYNNFVSAERNAIAAANERLKTHFMAAGPVAGQKDYDRYTTSLANAYGAAETGPESCAEASSLAADAARGDLNAFAAQAVPVATLPAAVCPADGNGMVLAEK